MTVLLPTITFCNLALLQLYAEVAYPLAFMKTKI